MPIEPNIKVEEDIKIEIEQLNKKINGIEQALKMLFILTEKLVDKIELPCITECEKESCEEIKMNLNTKHEEDYRYIG
jgi:hypothetical protein